MKHIITLALLFLAASGRLFAQCPPGEIEVTVTIVTDNYGNETTWTLTGPGGSPFYGSGSDLESNETYVDNYCVPEGAVLIFTINDAYGDGICCAYGSGSYTISGNGNTFASGGQFGLTEEKIFITAPAVAVDLAPLSLNLDNVVVQGDHTISGVIRNFGTTPVTSFVLNYSVNGGATYSQPINTTIAPNGNYTFNHETPWNATAGTHNIQIWATDVNGGTDENPVNDQMTVEVNVATQSVTRRTLIEEFTSSTCGPCATLNATFDPLLSSLNTNQSGSNILAVKYQMNWPAPGNDPSYNSDGNTRKNYYGVGGIPDVYIDGGDPSQQTWAGSINAAAAKPAFCDLLVEHVLNGTTADVTVTITPYANFSGTHKLYIAATEDHYYYPASTTSQDHFHYAMRKMMPNGNGITISNMEAGVPQTFTQSHTFTIGNPAQGNYNTWSTWLNNITFVAFVQDHANKSILQAAMSEITTGIEENEKELGFGMFPNPSTGLVNFDLALDHAGNVDIVVMDLLGAVVHSTNRSVGTGAQQFTIDLNELANGSYLVQLRSNGMMATRKLTINR